MDCAHLGHRHWVLPLASSRDDDCGVGDGEGLCGWQRGGHRGSETDPRGRGNFSQSLSLGGVLVITHIVVD